MPPKVSFSKEVVLQCAFEVVRKDGFGALTARRVADELQCSTRPVYATFESMKALQGGVIEKAREYALDYFLIDAAGSESPFLGLGLRYLRFSQEEKELFRLLYLEGKIGGTFDDAVAHFAPLLDRMKQDPRLSRLSDSALKRLGTNAWVYTHGLITLIYAFKPANGEELMREYVSQMGRMLIEWEQNQTKEVAP